MSLINSPASVSVTSIVKSSPIPLCVPNTYGPKSSAITFSIVNCPTESDEYRPVKLTCMLPIPQP